jgi:hypothetical protein
MFNALYTLLLTQKQECYFPDLGMHTHSCIYMHTHKHIYTHTSKQQNSEPAKCKDILWYKLESIICLNLEGKMF